MYGVKSVLSSVGDVVTKLDNIKANSQKADNVLSKCAQLEKIVNDLNDKHTTIQKTVTNLSTQLNSNEQQDELLKKIENLESVVFGQEDTTLYQNNPNVGVLDKND